MEELILIPVEHFCISHQIEIQWIKSLEDFGLVKIVTKKDLLYIPENELKKLERILVFNRELDINLEGIEAIFQLLSRLEKVQERVLLLENQLQKFK